MMLWERKTSHFGAVGEREEDEWELGKWEGKVSDFQITLKKINNLHVFLFFWYAKGLKRVS